MQVERKEERGRSDAFQDGKWDAGGVRFIVRDRFPAIEIGDTHDASPVPQFRPSRVRSRTGAISECDTF